MVLLRKLFEGNLSNIFMSSTKSSTGHLLGASGAIESIFSILTLKEKILPPTLNLDNPSDDCREINLIPHLKVLITKVILFYQTHLVLEVQTFH